MPTAAAEALALAQDSRVRGLLHSARSTASDSRNGSATTGSAGHALAGPFQKLLALGGTQLGGVQMDRRVRPPSKAAPSTSPRRQAARGDHAAEEEAMWIGLSLGSRVIRPAICQACMTNVAGFVTVCCSRRPCQTGLLFSSHFGLRARYKGASHERIKTTS